MKEKINYQCNCSHCQEIRKQQYRHGEWLKSLTSNNKEYVQIK